MAASLATSIMVLCEHLYCIPVEQQSQSYSFVILDRDSVSL